MNMDSSPSNPEQGPAYNHFADRTPSNETEEALMALQLETDGAGLTAYGQLMRGNLGAVNDYGLTEAAQLAFQLLQQSPLATNTPTQFNARYLYETTARGPKIVYPIDTFCYIAEIVGEITAVVPVMVDHPRINRRGPKGIRLCAAVKATRVMGMQMIEPELFYVPISEVQTENSPCHQLRAEMLEPVDRT